VPIFSKNNFTSVSTFAKAKHELSAWRFFSLPAKADVPREASPGNSLQFIAEPVKKTFVTVSGRQIPAGNLKLKPKAELA
jgi:hypothetical protein